MNTQSKPESLVVENLITSFPAQGRKVAAVNDISFSVPKGKTLVIVGESGCGKSMTALSIMRLVPQPGYVEGGKIWLHGQNLLALSPNQMEKIRGDRVSMIFQEPMTALNPVLQIGDQISEVFFYHRGLSKSQSQSHVIEMLKAVGIPAPEKRASEYPHQLSGGMRQRVMIAMALGCQPDLLIADEPTTALDVTIQMQILELMKDLQSQKGMSILFITHDLGVVAEMCEEVVVMYAGRVVEKAPVRELFKNPQHPYTQGLMASRIGVTQKRGERLREIKGVVPSLTKMPVGCAFSERCTLATDKCRTSQPQLKEVAIDHSVSCFEVGP